MNLLDNLQLGVSVAISPENILLCLVGALLGTLIGVLPGLGAIATIAMLLPITYGLDPVGAIIMIAGIYYGAQYGGSTTAILVNIPGEVSSVVTTLDGYQMAKRGRAGPALAIAAIGSVIAGIFATFLIAFLAVPLSSVAFAFGPAEYFSLMALGLVLAVSLSNTTLLRSLLMIGAGLLLSTIGTDMESGVARLTFGRVDLLDGVDFVVLTMGLFGIAEILANVTQSHERSVLAQPIRGLLPTRRDLRLSLPAIGRGTAIGSVLGILPGGGTVLSGYASYLVEKRISATPQQFGEGAIQGVAGPESANNAAAQTSFIPMLALGIPSNAIMALMAGALLMHGVTPGPSVISKQPELFWGLIVSMLIGNLMLLVINLPLIGIWVRLLKVPYRLLFPAITVFCCIGVYSVAMSQTDLLLTTLFGLVGYALVKWGYPVAPLVLAFVLGPMIEDNLRRAMLLSRGDMSIFVTEPLSLALLLLAAIVLVLTAIPSLRRQREVAFAE